MNDAYTASVHERLIRELSGVRENLSLIHTELADIKRLLGSGDRGI